VAGPMPTAHRGGRAHGLAATACGPAASTACGRSCAMAGIGIHPERRQAWPHGLGIVAETSPQAGCRSEPWHAIRLAIDCAALNRIWGNSDGGWYTGDAMGRHGLSTEMAARAMPRRCGRGWLRPGEHHDMPARHPGIVGETCRSHVAESPRTAIQSDDGRMHLHHDRTDAGQLRAL